MASLTIVSPRPTRAPSLATTSATRPLVSALMSTQRLASVRPRRTRSRDRARATRWPTRTPTGSSASATDAPPTVASAASVSSGSPSVPSWPDATQTAATTANTNARMCDFLIAGAPVRTCPRTSGFGGGESRCTWRSPRRPPFRDTYDLDISIQGTNQEGAVAFPPVRRNTRTIPPLSVVRPLHAAGPAGGVVTSRRRFQSRNPSATLTSMSLGPSRS